MPNTLTLSGIADDIYAAKDLVAQELVGFIPSITVNSGSERISLNGTVSSYVTSEPTLDSAITPAMTIPSANDETITTETMTVTNAFSVKIPLVGSTENTLDNTFGSQNVLRDRIAQGIRKIVNTLESHVASVVYLGASRAVGTAGTAPFGSNFDVLNEARKILADNGAPMEDGQLTLVMNTQAGMRLRNLASVYKVNEAGSDDPIRRGVLLDISGIKLKESAQVRSHTAGAGTGYDINNGSGEAIGQTTITLDGGTVNSTGVRAGDCVTFAGDNNVYVVRTGTTSTAGDIVLNAPGLVQLAADATEMTIGSSYTANCLFHRAAVELALRPPAQPLGGDAALDRMVIQDSRSGLVFDAAIYKGYRMNTLFLEGYYQAKVWKSPFVAIVRG